MSNQLDQQTLKEQQVILLQKLVEQYEQLIEQTRDKYNKDNLSMFNVQQIAQQSKLSIVITHNIQEIRSFEVNLKFKKKENLFKITIVASKLCKDLSSQNKQIKLIDQQKVQIIRDKQTHDESFSQQIEPNVPQQSIINNQKGFSAVVYKDKIIPQENKMDSLENQQVDTNFQNNQQTIEEDLEQILFEKNVSVPSNEWTDYFVIATDGRIEIQFSQNQKQV